MNLKVIIAMLLSLSILISGCDLSQICPVAKGTDLKSNLLLDIICFGRDVYSDAKPQAPTIETCNGDVSCKGFRTDDNTCMEDDSGVISYACSSKGFCERKITPCQFGCYQHGAAVVCAECKKDEDCQGPDVKTCNFENKLILGYKCDFGRCRATEKTCAYGCKILGGEWGCIDKELSCNTDNDCRMQLTVPTCLKNKNQESVIWDYTCYNNAGTKTCVPKAEYCPGCSVQDNKVLCTRPAYGNIKCNTKSDCSSQIGCLSGDPVNRWLVEDADCGPDKTCVLKTRICPYRCGYNSIADRDECIAQDDYCTSDKDCKKMHNHNTCSTPQTWLKYYCDLDRKACTPKIQECAGGCKQDGTGNTVCAA